MYTIQENSMYILARLKEYSNINFLLMNISMVSKKNLQKKIETRACTGLNL